MSLQVGFFSDPTSGLITLLASCLQLVLASCYITSEVALYIGSVFNSSLQP